MSHTKVRTHSVMPKKARVIVAEAFLTSIYTSLEVVTLSLAKKPWVEVFEGNVRNIFRKI